MGINTAYRGVSGISAARSASFNRPFIRDAGYVPGGVIVQGSKWIDPGNTGSTRNIRAGHVGMLTSNKIVPAFLGVMTADYADNAVAMTVGVPTAQRIEKAYGQSGTVYVLAGTSAPTTLATVIATAVAFTAVNTSTGVLTVPDLNVSLESDGSFIVGFQPMMLGGAGGISSPNQALCVLDRAEGISVIDADANDIDVDVAEAAIEGLLDIDALPLWPTNAFVGEVLAANLRAANPNLRCNNKWT
jgi:hypothetical protein